MTLTAQQLVELVRRSQLVDPEQLRTACASLREHLRSLPPEQHLLQVAGELTKRGLITEWQLKNLLAGKARGFFFGNYKLLSPLGRGGMGTVYLAEHTRMQRRVALKVLPAAWANQPTFLERFLREARAIAVLDHPNIVRAYDFDSIEGSHFLALEYIDGKDLASHVRLADQPLPIPVVLDYIAQAAAGLEYAHQRGIVHRDVKPSNLLIDANGCVKLLDLGLARWSAEEISSVTVAHNQSLLGTADYLAPEQALNSHTVDHRADIYSLGCTLYFALVGEPPFPEGTIAQKVAQHQIAPRPDPLGKRPEISEALNAICKRMMAIQADDRYTSAAEVIRELRAMEIPPTAPGKAGPPATREPSESASGNEALPDVPSFLVHVNPTSADTLRTRPLRIKRPPFLFWIILGLMLITALVLGYLVYRQS